MHRHANGHSVSHLLQDRRLHAIGHAGRDLHAADDRSRMQHHRLGRVLGQPLAGELVAGLVLVQVQLQPGQTLRLDAQHHHRLRLAQRRLKVPLDLDSRS